VRDAGGDLDPLRTGVVLGVTMVGARALLDAQHLLDTEGPDAVPRKLNIQVWPNKAAGQIAIHYGLHGPLLTVSSACASSKDAIGTAARMIGTG
jgi:3-oxoacyl-[acyl-carrier-protein] synthase II